MNSSQKMGVDVFLVFLFFLLNATKNPGKYIKQIIGDVKMQKEKADRVETLGLKEQHAWEFFLLFFFFFIYLDSDLKAGNPERPVETHKTSSNKSLLSIAKR